MLISQMTITVEEGQRMSSTGVELGEEVGAGSTREWERTYRDIFTSKGRAESIG